MSDTNYQFLIRMIGHQMKYLGDKKLEAHNITLEQGYTLGYFVRHQHESITQKQMEKAFQRKGSSISSIVTNLEKKGFIERKTDLQDERKKIIKPLPKAIAIVEEFNVFFKELEKEMVKDFSNEEKELLSNLLGRVSKNLEQEKN